MNLDENNKFEEQLREFRPSRVRPKVESNIRRGLDRGDRMERRRRLGSLIAWGSVAVAASLLITFGFLLFNGRLAFNSVESGSPTVEPLVMDADPVPTEETVDSFKPILAENNLQNRVDEGIVFLRNGLTARRYRYEFLDRVVWENPTNGAIVEMEVPRDEVILVPVQTY